MAENAEVDPKRENPEQVQLDGVSDGIEALPGRLGRYGKAKKIALDVADYMDTLPEHKAIARRVHSCGDYLVFRHYFTVDQVKLHGAQLCMAHLLCPLCAIRRGSKALKAYLDRWEVIRAEKTALRPFLVTLTVKDGPDLEERFNHLHKAQRELWSLPCAPAREVYTGVLYEAAQLREGDDVTIFSGLFGATGGEDLIPAYRLSMNVKLPRAGALKTYWRRHLKAEMFAAEVSESATDAAYDPNQVTVDMRSGAYLVWNPPGPWWDVRVRDSSGKVITHMAKHYRGLLTRALLDAKSDDVAAVARTLGTVEVDEDGLKRHLTLTPTDA